MLSDTFRDCWYNSGFLLYYKGLSGYPGANWDFRVAWAGSHHVDDISRILQLCQNMEHDLLKKGTVLRHGPHHIEL